MQSVRVVSFSILLSRKLLHFLLLCTMYDVVSPRSMRTSTSKVVTCLDIGVIVGAAASSVICSLMGLAQTKEMNRRLYEVCSI